MPIVAGTFMMALSRHALLCRREMTRDAMSDRCSELRDMLVYYAIERRAVSCHTVLLFDER